MHYIAPTRVKRVNPKQTDITWNDGHLSSYPSWYLRENCMCADCVDEFTGKRKIGHGSIPSTVERVSVTPVGNYALNFGFSDGHASGLYTFEYLRELCPCSQCLPEGLQEPPESVPKPGSFEV
ncbi:MAG: DUF971 domain-containing protein [Acidobacteriota bacterium]|nr:DUF971 domain-containing protein [Acidobacteriota bacterium]